MARLLPDNCARYDSELIEIDLKSKRLSLADGKTIHYEQLVLCLPLCEIVNRIWDTSSELCSAAENLLYTSIYVLSLGIEGDFPPWFLLHVPAAELGVYRLSFPSYYSPDCARQHILESNSRKHSCQVMFIETNY
jgi:protoporphyrinogen oxidase